MNAHSDLDRQLSDFLRDGPEELPYQSFDAVRDLTEQTGQRVVIGPWRLPEMNKIVTIGLSAAAVVILVFLGAQLFGSPSGGTGDSPDPTATPELTASPEPSPSEAAAPPLTQSFTSTQHGITVSYPEGWTTQAATEPWTASAFPLSFGAPQVDWLYDPVLEYDLFLAIASQSIGDSTPEDWVADQMASEEGCSATEPVTVDGGSGLIGCTQAVVTAGGRGYWIQLYTGSSAPATGYDLALLEEILATVQLQPEDAVD